MGYANCKDSTNNQICKYFGLKTLPTVIRVTNSEFFFMPVTYDKTAENLLTFMVSDYLEAFIQGPISETEDGGWDTMGFNTFGNRFMRTT